MPSSTPQTCCLQQASNISGPPYSAITRRNVRGEGTRIENQATTGRHAQPAPLGRGPTRTTARSFQAIATCAPNKPSLRLAIRNLAGRHPGNPGRECLDFSSQAAR